MTKLATEKIHNWRQMMKDRGGKFISTCLPPDTAQQFEELQQHFYKSKSKVTRLIKRAIIALYDDTFPAK